MTTLLLDTHVLQGWSAEPERLSCVAAEAIAGADELAVAGISWYELAWLAAHERIVLTIPISSWLAQLASGVRTVGINRLSHTPQSRCPRSSPATRRIA